MDEVTVRHYILAITCDEEEVLTEMEDKSLKLGVSFKDLQ